MYGNEKLLKAFWSYTPYKVKKCSTFAKETLKWRTMQYKQQQQQQKTEYQECTVYQGFLNSYFL